MLELNQPNYVKSNLVIITRGKIGIEHYSKINKFKRVKDFIHVVKINKMNVVA